MYGHGQSATRSQPSPLLPSSGPLAPGNGARRGSTSSESFVRQAIETSAAAAGHKKPERTFTETLKVSPLGIHSHTSYTSHTHQQTQTDVCSHLRGCMGLPGIVGLAFYVDGMCILLCQYVHVCV